MGFVLFNQNTNNDDKNIETNFIFAHEVAAGYYGDTYHDYGEDEDYMTISSTWKRNYFRQKCVHQLVTQNLPSIYVFYFFCIKDAKIRLVTTWACITTDLVGT